MRLLSLLLFFLGLALASCNLAQFALMIKQRTGRSARDYNGYGCYCGWGGSKQPLDATDRCCHAHDCCYKKLTSSHCSPKTVIYLYSSRGNQITCGGGTSCQKRTCACDKAAVDCFKRAAGTYSKSYDNYPQSKCKGRTPSC